MTARHHALLPEPDDISDATAAELTQFLFDLAGACDARYGAKILRYEARHRAIETAPGNLERPQPP